MILIFVLGITPFAISIGSDVNKAELEQLVSWKVMKTSDSETAVHTLFQAVNSAELTNPFFMGSITMSLCNYATQCEFCAISAKIIVF